MANGNRNRDKGSIGTGKCVRIEVCKRHEAGTSRCAKGKCASFKDPKDPKRRKK